MFRDAGLEVRFLDPVARPERLSRLRSGEADLALMDAASFVDSVATDSHFDAICIQVLGHRLPMAAVFVSGRHAAGAPIQEPADLVRARYGGEAGSSFVMEHRALLRRLDGDDPSLHVEMPYDDLFGALASGEIDVAPDYVGIATTYQRALRAGETVGFLRYWDCGVRAYGTGFVAAGAAVDSGRDALVSFLDVTAESYQEMRSNPNTVIEAASALLPDIDRAYAIREWQEEEEEALFGGEGYASSDPTMWAQTTAWRKEVVDFQALPPADRLYMAIRAS
jgi:ABC-type nitrate/sulfonate/bicarbonate transport system substrate-binding protein